MVRNIILFVNNINSDGLKAARELRTEVNKPVKLAVIREPSAAKLKIDEHLDLIIKAKFKSSKSLITALKPYQESLLAVVAYSEKNIVDYARLAPFVPYVRTPSRDSLAWATDKIAMRERLKASEPKLSPKYMVINDAKASTLKEVSTGIGFPVVVKPTNLASSLLVSICYHAEELEEVLNKTFRKIKKIYKDNHRQEVPRVLVEEFMDGEMYSTDVYIDARGRATCCPMVLVKTGRTIGFDDFFNYSRLTPSGLNKTQIALAEEAAIKSVQALNLKSLTAHVELMLVNGVFKIIELGPRVGGFRHKMYELSYGINHLLNDIKVRVPLTLNVSKKVKGYTAVLRFYPREEGKIVSISGLKRVKELKSLVAIKQQLKIGDVSKFAKHGGKSVFDITLYNSHRSDLLADVRRTEKAIKILTKKK